MPASIRQAEALDWPALSEAALLSRMREVAARNKVMTSLMPVLWVDDMTRRFFVSHDHFVAANAVCVITEFAVVWVEFSHWVLLGGFELLL